MGTSSSDFSASKTPSVSAFNENSSIFPEGCLEFCDCQDDIVKFTLADGAVAPFKKHISDSGFDFTALSVKPHDKNPEVLVYDTGVNVEIPPGCEIQIRPRSSIRDYDLVLINSPGTVDNSYRGRIYINFRKIPRHDGSCQVYQVGDRIAQGVVAYVMPVKWQKVDTLESTERGSGGFGSTGK